MHEGLRQALDDSAAGGAVSGELRTAMARRYVELPETVRLSAGKAEDEWIVGDPGRTYTLRECEFEYKADGSTQKGTELVVYSEAPNPDNEGVELPDAYAQAHHIWYVFTGIGFTAFFALLVFKFVTNAIDRKGHRDEGT